MPSEDASTVNETLTIYAQGFMAQRESTLLDFMAPVVPTGVTKGDYKKFDADAPFQEYDTEIPAGSEAPTVAWNAKDEPYRCKPNGLKVPSLDEDEKAAPPAAREIIREGKLATLLSAQLVNREVKGWRKLTSSITAESGKGTWVGVAGQSADVVDEIDELIERINNQTGMMPGYLALGLSAWRVIKHHPSVLSAFNGISSHVTPEAFAAMLLNPNIQIKIGSMPYNTAKRGLDAVKKGIVGSDLFVFNKSANPTVNDMSACKTFSVDGNLITAVHTIRDDLKHVEFDEVRWSEDVQVTAPISIARITVK